MCALAKQAFVQLLTPPLGDPDYSAESALLQVISDLNNNAFRVDIITPIAFQRESRKSVSNCLVYNARSPVGL